MKLVEKGILEHSHMYFYTPSAAAKRALVYPLCAGEFYCDGDYAVRRERYDSFLLLLVLEGEMRYLKETARAGELLLIDCHAPHAYDTKTGAHTLWLHFDGGGTAALFSELLSLKGVKQKSPAELAEQLREVMQGIKKAEHEAAAASRIYNLLCGLLRPGTAAAAAPEAISEAKAFLRAHLEQEIAVADVAAAVNMSASHFSKVFKEATGASPYAYLLSLRVEKAKDLLLNTTRSVSEISVRTGFHSDANFISCFKKETGLSPLQFRKMRF